MNNLIDNTCITNPEKLDGSEIDALLVEIELWEFNKEKNTISRELQFKNYYKTISFVNAVAWVVHQENHHPDINISYNKCHITFSTHSVNGLSKNDFICAAKINCLVSS